MTARLRALEEENEVLRRRLLELEHAQRPSAPGEGKAGTLIVVSAAKGGVGKSVTSGNLATGLAEIYGRRTVLVDGNLAFGDQAVLLNVHARTGLAQLADVTSIDLGIAETLLTPLPSGLSVLVSPPDPVIAETISPNVVTELVQLYRSTHDFVVVDTLPGLSELNLQLFDVADRILLVVTPEMNTIAHTSQFLQVARDLGYADKITLLLNRANTGLELSWLESHLGIPVSASMVSAGAAFVQAANSGVALISKDRAGLEPVTRDLWRLVELVAGEPLPGQLAARSSPAAPVAGRLVRRPPLGRIGRRWALSAGLAAAWLASLLAATIIGRGAVNTPAAATTTPQGATIAATVASVSVAAAAEPTPVPRVAQVEAPPAVLEEPPAPTPAPIARVSPLAEAPAVVPEPAPVEASAPQVEPQASPAPPDPGPEAPAPATGTLFAAGRTTVSVHRTPSLAGATIRLVPVGTVVELLGGAAVAGGQQWQQVRIPTGEEGWVLALAVRR